MKGEALNRWEAVEQAFPKEREKSVSDERAVKILVVHTDRLFREALAIALAASEETIHIIAGAAAPEALARHVTHRPDIVLLGGQGRIMDVYRRAIRLRRWWPPVLVLLMSRPIATARPPLIQVQEQAQVIDTTRDGQSFHNLLQRVHRVSRKLANRPAHLSSIEPGSSSASSTSGTRACRRTCRFDPA